MSKLSEYRRDAGLTQQNVAEILTVTQSTISQWETGRCLPTTDKLRRLALLYECTVDELIGQNNSHAQQTA